MDTDNSLVARSGGTLSASVESANALLNLREKISQNTALVSDEWLDRLIKWADECEIPDYLFPRDREKLRVVEKIIIPHYCNLKAYFLSKEARVRYSKSNTYVYFCDDDFDDTDIRRLPDELGNLCFLKTLLLDDKYIHFSGDMKLICKLKSLKSLSLLYCKFLPDKFANLQNLKYLWLNNHNFKEFPSVITKLKKLKYISLNHKDIVLWFSFDGKPNILFADKPTDNPIRYGFSTLPDEFANLQNLAMLSLLGNKFVRFPQVIFELPKLEYLWIDEYLITPSIAQELKKRDIQVYYE